MELTRRRFELVSDAFRFFLFILLILESVCWCLFLLMSGVDQCIQKFLDVARQTECFFLQKRLQLSVQKPEQVVKEVNSHTDLHSHLPWIFWSGPLHLPSTLHDSWSPNHLCKHKMNSRRTQTPCCELLSVLYSSFTGSVFGRLCDMPSVFTYYLFITVCSFLICLLSPLTCFLLTSGCLRVTQRAAEERAAGSETLVQTAPLATSARGRERSAPQTLRPPPSWTAGLSGAGVRESAPRPFKTKLTH